MNMLKTADWKSGEMTVSFVEGPNRVFKVTLVEAAVLAAALTHRFKPGEPRAIIASFANSAVTVLPRSRGPAVPDYVDYFVVIQGRANPLLLKLADRACREMRRGLLHSEDVCSLIPQVGIWEEPSPEGEGLNSR